MNNLEKAYSLFAVFFAITLMWLLATTPEMRQMSILLTACGVGLFINVIFMFIVFRDIFYRPSLTRNAKFFWTALLLLFWPAILIYLPLHGFRKRSV